MLFIQLTGLSGAGKSTIAFGAKKQLEDLGFKVEVLDGDEYRKHLCKDLGFSKEDRNENIRRLSFVAVLLARNEVIPIIAAINPYESIRNEIKNLGGYVKTVWIDCPLEVLIKRDTKGIYKKALYEDGRQDKITNLTGINDPYELPVHPDLIITTDKEPVEKSIKKLVDFITLSKLSPQIALSKI